MNLKAVIRIMFGAGVQLRWTNSCTTITNEVVTNVAVYRDTPFVCTASHVPCS